MAEDIEADAIELSISIVNYNTTESVLKLIESISENVKNISYEILVVDNASSDNVAVLTDKYREVKLIRSSTNHYFTKADNINLHRANGEYILSINPDTLVTPNAVENMIAFLKKHKDVGAVTPKFIYPDGRLQVSFTPFLTLKFCLLEAIGYNKLFPNNTTKCSIAPGIIHYDTDTQHEAEVLYGACIMIRREVLKTAGLKDEKFVHGWDEYDWCKSIKEKGWKLFYAPSSTIVHYRSESIGKIQNDSHKINAVDRYGKEGYHYLLKKHFGYGAYVVFKLCCVLNILVSKIVSILR